jgi:hypothetical protein
MLFKIIFKKFKSFNQSSLCGMGLDINLLREDKG